MIADEILPIILRFRWKTPNPVESEKFCEMIEFRFRLAMLLFIVV
jgi:hypothetical protein